MIVSLIRNILKGDLDSYLVLKDFVQEKYNIRTTKKYSLRSLERILKEANVLEESYDSFVKFYKEYYKIPKIKGKRDVLRLYFKNYEIMIDKNCHFGSFYIYKGTLLHGTDLRISCSNFWNFVLNFMFYHEQMSLTEKLGMSLETLG